MRGPDKKPRKKRSPNKVSHQNKQKLNCDICGKEIYRWPTQIKSEKVFCSWKCANGRKDRESIKVSDLSILLEEKLESYYWIGYLMADGHFQNRGQIALVSIDIEHLEKFTGFVKYEGERKNKGNISLMDKVVVKRLMNKFNISHRKTYEPCDINISNLDLFVSLVIGFIDGDGSIRKQTNRNDCLIAIKCHSSWFENLKIMNRIMSEIININEADVVRINKKGYALLIWSNSKVLRFLKEFILATNLPVLKRKWNKIDEGFISGQELAAQRVGRVKELLDKDYNKSEIAEILGVNKSAVTLIIQRNKIPAYIGRKERRENYVSLF